MEFTHKRYQPVNFPLLLFRETAQAAKHSFEVLKDKPIERFQRSSNTKDTEKTTKVIDYFDFSTKWSVVCEFYACFHLRCFTPFTPPPLRCWHFNSVMNTFFFCFLRYADMLYKVNYRLWTDFCVTIVPMTLCYFAWSSVQIFLIDFNETGFTFILRNQSHW